jgi:hypothetical protein
MYSALTRLGNKIPPKFLCDFGGIFLYKINTNSLQTESTLVSILDSQDIHSMKTNEEVKYFTLHSDALPLSPDIFCHPYGCI